jgi:hypothetical protein
MEGKREGSHAWRSMEGEGEGSHAWWRMEGEGKIPFHLFPLSPQPILLKPSIFPFDFKVLLCHGIRLLLMHFLPFFDL